MLKIFPGERCYKFIEVKTFDSQRKKFLSKIDKNGKITIYTYTYDLNETTQDGRILNRHNTMLIGPIPEIEFQTVINVNICVYPEFEILFEKDYSHMTQEEAFKEMTKDDLIRIEKVDEGDTKIEGETKILKETKKMNKEGGT